MHIKPIVSNLVLSLFLMLFTELVVAETNSTNDAINTTSYQIGPGDVLQISVWKEEGMDQQILVRPDGEITFPLIGEVQAGGLTTRMLSDALVAKLKKIYS